MSIIEKIRAHEQEVSSGKVPDDLRHCPRCKEKPQSFKLHDVKSRLFLVIIEGFVHSIRSFLGRWKCALCGYCFTYYPDFALPYKRYVKDTIVQLSRDYGEDDEASYRKGVQNKGSPIGYKGVDKIDERHFVGSPLWRWLRSIGSLEESLRSGLNLIRQKSPSSGIFRNIRPVAPHKYRSDKRKKLPGRCVRFFFVEDEFKALFGCSIFPKYATGYS